MHLVHFSLLFMLMIFLRELLNLQSCLNLSQNICIYGHRLLSKSVVRYLGQPHCFSLNFSENCVQTTSIASNFKNNERKIIILPWSLVFAVPSNVSGQNQIRISAEVLHPGLEYPHRCASFKLQPNWTSPFLINLAFCIN